MFMKIPKKRPVSAQCLSNRSSWLLLQTHIGKRHGKSRLRYPRSISTFRKISFKDTERMLHYVFTLFILTNTRGARTLLCDIFKRKINTRTGARGDRYSTQLRQHSHKAGAPNAKSRPWKHETARGCVTVITSPNPGTCVNDDVGFGSDHGPSSMP